MTRKRSIFEDVATVTESSSPAQEAAGIIDRGRGQANRSLMRVWLILLFLLVVMMILVGGLTRLTDSGLSITEWRPVSGALPPLSEQDWSEEFEKYKQIPEYLLQNKGMSLQSFKVIYWWEWGHRQLGRVVGLVWAIGFLFFYFTNKIPTGWTPKLLL
ncbi:MAG: COX15/CtaA family protein, partial [Marinovum sp.]|nr:COX15/CtaA family protein [Marinovum sp.]